MDVRGRVHPLDTGKRRQREVPVKREECDAGDSNPQRPATTVDQTTFALLGIGCHEKGPNEKSPDEKSPDEKSPHEKSPNEKRLNEMRKVPKRKSY